MLLMEKDLSKENIMVQKCARSTEEVATQWKLASQAWFSTRIEDKEL